MYTEEQIEEFRIKVEKWDALGKQIEDRIKEESECDLVTIGELAAITYGWL